MPIDWNMVQTLITAYVMLFLAETALYTGWCLYRRKYGAPGWKYLQLQKTLLTVILCVHGLRLLHVITMDPAVSMRSSGWTVVLFDRETIIAQIIATAFVLTFWSVFLWRLEVSLKMLEERVNTELKKFGLPPISFRT